MTGASSHVLSSKSRPPLFGVGPPLEPTHALLPAERAAVEAALATPAWVDHSCRDLAMDLYETAGFSVSHVSIWRHQVARQLNGPRGVQRQRRVRPPDPLPRPSAPNQCWAWDISVPQRAA